MLVGCPVRQPGVPQCWLAMVNRQQRAAGLLRASLPGTTSFSALINGLEMNPGLPPKKFKGGKWVCRVIGDKTAPSSKFQKQFAFHSIKANFAATWPFNWAILNHP